ncbi:MAG: GNAT family N-acetyltransferase [Pseudomonadota bacterium]
MTPVPNPKLTAEGLALTHSMAFDGKGWSEATFESYLNDQQTLIFGTDSCFAVVRLLASEAEILTLATRPSGQGKGRATRMLLGALDQLEDVGVEVVYLDVSDQNTAARALYAKCGFTGFDLRHNYYRDGTTAICMRADLKRSNPPKPRR